MNRPIEVPGFQFAGVACGIKKGKKKDLALIFSERPASAAAIFTTNRIKASPVKLGIKRIRRGKIQTVVINSGNANACNGARGDRDAEAMCHQAAASLGIDAKLVIPSSTGVIGELLPMARVRRGIERAVAALSPQSMDRAAEAILTSDQFAKVSVARFRLEGRRAIVAGMAKGAGMIAPRMATMLAYILTDVAVETSTLRDILHRTAEKTFRRRTALSRGAAGQKESWSRPSSRS
jgi:glutamate N-acetyltransferase/amino-acid N-acetyltransferase